MQNKDQEANPCEAPHIHYIQAARGWLELGDARSALEEIRRIDADLGNHPDFLLLAWDVHAALRNWEEAYRISDYLVKVTPEDLQSWLNRSESIRHMDNGGIEAAYKTLLSATKIFSENYRFHFWLARYACRAGRAEEAKRWLARSSELGIVKAMAMDEADLEPIWDFCCELDY